MPVSMKDSVMQAHQKAPFGNSRTLYYIVDRLWSPKNMDDLVYMTQLSQAYCARVATESWRTRKGRCNGSLYWQLNDCWGVTSWSGYDYYGNPKAVHYESKRFNAPRTVVILADKDKRTVYAINDTLSDGDFEVVYGLVCFDGKTVYEQTRPITLKAGEIKEIATIKPREHGRSKSLAVFAFLKTKDGKVIASRCHTAEKEKKCHLTDPKITYSTSLSDGTYEIKLRASAYARGVEISLKGIDGEFSDNFFDMPAGAEVTVTLPVSSTDKEELDKALRIRSLYDIERKQSAAQDKMFATKVFMEPFNLANWIYRTKE